MTFKDLKKTKKRKLSYYIESTFQVPPADRNMMYENRILGLPRIRMLKVKDDSCAVEASFEKAIRKCYASYAQEHEDQDTTVPDFRKYSSEGA